MVAGVADTEVTVEFRRGRRGPREVWRLPAEWLRWVGHDARAEPQPEDGR
jgi:hypothetical protein